MQMMLVSVNALLVKMMTAMECVGTDVTVGVGSVVTAAYTKVVMAMTHAAEITSTRPVVYFLMVFTAMSLTHVKKFQSLNACI